MEDERRDSTPRGGMGFTAVWVHDGEPAALVRELKYGRATAVVTRLADAMAEQAPPADLVSWVPASPARRRQRGFDQGELLARAIARRLRLPVRRRLRRVDDEPQTGRGRDGRLVGPEFSPVGRRLRFRPTVLLVDDVATTGTTLRAAAEVLGRRGARRVEALVATHAIASRGSAPVRPGVYDRSTTRSFPGGQEWTSPSVHGMSTSRRDWRR